MRIQRNHLYAARQHVMETPQLQDMAMAWLERGINLFLDEHPNWTTFQLKELISNHISYKIIDIPDNLAHDRDRLVQWLKQLCQQVLKNKTKELVDDKQLNQYYRSAMLSALDKVWIDEVSYLSDLRTTTRPWQFAQRDTGYIYQVEALKSYRKMLQRARKQTVDNLMLGEISVIKGKMYVWLS